MTAERDNSSERMEFETFPGRADIQVSKILTTEAGDEVRAVVTTGGAVVLTRVGKPTDDILIVNGLDPGDEGGGAIVYLSWLDFLKPFTDELAKKVMGGGGQKCTSVTTTVVDAKAGTTTTTTTMTCVPA